MDQPAATTAMNTWYRRLWDGEGSDGGAFLKVLGLGLAPAEWSYRAAVFARNAAYDRAWIKSRSAPIPTLVIGNLSVGGTGKTPMAAWFVKALRERGCRAAVVMRGYGGDEVEVHRQLNPASPVYADPNRLRALRVAHKEGTNVAVLDDAFQHRALKADAAVVLIAAEEWTTRRRLLPRGPWREPLNALGRATLVVVTRKTATSESAARVARTIAELNPGLAIGQVEVRIGSLAEYGGDSLYESEPVGPIDGLQCAVALAGVARPEAVWQQLERFGIGMERRWVRPDHHKYRQAEIRQLSRLAASGPIIATLKDAVKLRPALGPSVRILVPLQQIVWESGGQEAIRLLNDISNTSSVTS